MKSRESYKTKQKDLIIEDIKKHKEEFTVKDIYNELNSNIGLTTIYRFIDKLVEEGHINKTIGKDNVTYYQYLEDCDKDNHFFLKCESCGVMEHIDCDCIEELSNHISKEHNFALTDHIIINGKCKKCLKEGV